ncbi:Aconitase 3-isopropylmalate dehydratase large subunit, alpha beta alpha, subdomain 1 3 [Fusarium agapanthi]|uniref:Aconitase 3-isopropylmalate dehydratase large subunit, alpha beta alpha, subdomain 1 3 n=1 Tax=Fusarium agapanthi TaxID=1803897 RepID=A0A9P5B162_9HYPO|nr:Aconitase 3-isopropylmalate dehydratase large subunit, alpha beta alpha, subdomain 1 3 [Fusarium agapanthi]
MYGALGCLGVAVVRTDAAAIYATGRTWWECPPVARLKLTGVLPKGVTGKDVIVALCGLFNNDVLNHCIEFTGSEETMSSIPVDTRLTVVFPIDATLERWLRYKATEAAIFPDRSAKERITHERIDELLTSPLAADPDALYAKQLYLSLGTLSPYVSGPNSVKIATPLHELAPKNIKINKAYLVSCTNSRHSDIQAAAAVFKEAAKANEGVVPKVADGVKMYIAAASSREQEAAEDSGDWQVLLDAGAEALVSDLALGLLNPVKMGSPILVVRKSWPLAHSKASSPVQVLIKYPRIGLELTMGMAVGSRSALRVILNDVVQQLDSFIGKVESKEASSNSAVVEILPGFPESVRGEIVFMGTDNQNTDQIYPGSMTYESNVSKEAMAKACMRNYDPDFQKVIRPNDILVSGNGFGCGSSREQAATAILANSIHLVVAGSFSNIFSRNSITNGLMGLELPRLVQRRLRAAFPKDAKNPIPTFRTGWTLEWDVKKSMVHVQEGEARQDAKIERTRTGPVQHASEVDSTNVSGRGVTSDELLPIKYTLGGYDRKPPGLKAYLIPPRV